MQEMDVIPIESKKDTSSAPASQAPSEEHGKTDLDHMTTALGLSLFYRGVLKEPVSFC